MKNSQVNAVPDGAEKLREELWAITESPSYQLVRKQVYEALRKNIILGAIRGGERIVEGQIAEMAGVSRIPVREAFRMLETEGFVENLPRRGTRVIGVTEGDICEIFRIHGAVEELCCNYIVEEAAEETISEGKVILDLARAALEIRLPDNQPTPWNGEYDLRFNQWIGRASGRRRLGCLYEQYNSYIAILHKYRSIEPERWRQALEEHAAIWEALSRRDREAARRAVQIHAENSLEALARRREQIQPGTP